MEKEKTNAIVTATKPELTFIENLMGQAIDQKSPVETLERILVMRTELRKECAEEEFNLAMSRFQSDCPTIEKNKAVFEKNKQSVRYKYADLTSIVEQVKTILAKYGLSYRLNVTQDEKMIGVVCKVTHKSGHSEETQFSVQIGSEQYMSDVQKYGARVTFCKRYAFCNAFGIMTGDEDTDGRGEKATANKDALIADWQTALEGTTDSASLQKMWGQVPPQFKTKLLAVKNKLKTKCEVIN